MRYTQCVLEQNDFQGTVRRLVTYIPSDLAKIAKVLRLMNDDGEWESGWKVVSLGTSIDEEHLPDTHKAIKMHRKRTGDSLPKKG